MQVSLFLCFDLIIKGVAIHQAFLNFPFFFNLATKKGKCMEKIKVLFLAHDAIFMGQGEGRQLKKNVKSTLVECKKQDYRVVSLYNTNWLSEGKVDLDHLDVMVQNDLAILGNREKLIDFTNTNIYHSSSKNQDYDMRSLGKFPFYGLITKAELDLVKQKCLVRYEDSLVVGSSSEIIFCAQKAKINFEFDKYFFNWATPLYDDQVVIDTIQFLRKKSEIQIFLRGFIETFGLFFDLNTSKMGQTIFSGKMYNAYYLPLQNYIQKTFKISSLDAIYEVIIKALLFDFSYEN